MKTISRAFGVLLIGLQLAQASTPGKTASYPVEPRTNLNSITLDATNRLGMNLARVSPTIISKPAWVTIRSVSSDRNSLAPDSTLVITVLFDVGPSLKTGEKGVINIGLLSVNRTVLEHSISLIGAVPKSYGFSENYPNPFNPSTKIEYALPLDSRVKLSVFDALGRKVTTLVDDVRPAGYFTQEWDGTGRGGTRVSSGVYFIRIEANSVDGTMSFSRVKKAMMLK